MLCLCVSIVAKTIERAPVALESFADAITHSLRDEDDNPFMRRIVATRFRYEAAYSVINRKLFVKTDRGAEAHEYTCKSEWTDMMCAAFGMERGMLEQAPEFLGVRQAGLF